MAFLLRSMLEVEHPLPALCEPQGQQALFQQCFECFHQKEWLSPCLGKEPLAKSLEIRGCRHVPAGVGGKCKEPLERVAEAARNRF